MRVTSENALHLSKYLQCQHALATENEKLYSVYTVHLALAEGMERWLGWVSLGKFVFLGKSQNVDHRLALVYL